jgi:hypothetical protein
MLVERFGHQAASLPFFFTDSFDLGQFWDKTRDEV